MSMARGAEAPGGDDSPHSGMNSALPGGWLKPLGLTCGAGRIMPSRMGSRSCFLVSARSGLGSLASVAVRCGLLEPGGPANVATASLPPALDFSGPVAIGRHGQVPCTRLP